MKESENVVSLWIADNGKGFEMKEETNSLGLQLIKGLTKELRGTFQIVTTNGTQIEIQFKKDTVDQAHLMRETSFA
jgi:two-component sensor histidine kinase